MADAITATTNARVKEIVSLRKRRERDRTGLFVIEGARELKRATDANIELIEVFSCDELASPITRTLLSAVDSTAMSEKAFAKCSYRDRSDGVIAIARQFDTALGSFHPPPDSVLLALEAIEKPGNLGTMMRTALAAGAAGVICADPATDVFNPNVVRASLGALFAVPLVVTDTTTAIDWLTEKGFGIYSTTPAGDTEPWSVDFTSGAAVVVGSESSGLSLPWLDGASALVRIPMADRADSINAAMAAGVMLFEAARQRAKT